MNCYKLITLLFFVACKNPHTLSIVANPLPLTSSCVPASFPSPPTFSFAFALPRVSGRKQIVEMRPNAVRPHSTTQGSKNGYFSKMEPGGARNGYLSAGWQRKPPNAGPGMEGRATFKRGNPCEKQPLWRGMEVVRISRDKYTVTGGCE